MFLTKKYDIALQGIFNRYGQFIAKNAASAILFCILLNGLLGINIIWMKKVKDISIYTPFNSQAQKDGIRVKQQFSDYTGTNFYEQSLLDTGKYGILIVKTINGSNLLTAFYRNDLQKLFDVVRNISVSSDGITYSYKDLCAKRNNVCATNFSVLESDLFWTNVINNDVSYPVFTDSRGTQEVLFQVFGGVKLNNNSKVSSVKAFKMSFFLREDRRLYSQLASQWENKFVQTFKSYKSDCFDIAFSVSDSLGSELNANTKGDVRYFSLTFSLMITYVSFAAAGGNWVSQRGHLGRAGVIASGLAILGSFGICSAMGFEFVSLVGVMPFLIIGIGVDDMFIFLSAHSDAPLKCSPEERVGKTVESSGVAVTITSLTNIVAFTSGALSSFRSVQLFCVYTGVAVFLCYINQMTFFLGCLAIHERRVAANRHCVTCQQTKTLDALKAEDAGIHKIICCSGGPPKSRIEQESLCQKLPSLFIPRIILRTPVKLFIMLCSIGYIGTSVWGVLNLKQGLLIRNLVSETSYFQAYSNWNYDNFPATFIISVYLPPDLDYSNIKTRNKTRNLMEKICQDQDINCKNKIDWVSAFTSSKWFDDTNKISFCYNLKAFAAMNPMYSNDFVISDECNIVHSRFHVFSKNVKDTYLQGKLMQRMRETISEAFPGAFTFSPIYQYFEQYVAVLPNTLQTVGASVAAVFLITCVFMSNPFVIIYVTISMAMIMLGLLGFMHIWGLSLSSITMIHVIMSVGFSVDYSTHICHAFLISDGETRNIRVNEAIIRSGGPIMNGALSSLLGILILSGSESYVFNSFFKVMFLVIIFGLGQAIFFLPVVLSIVGPQKKPNIQKQVIFTLEEKGRDNFAFSEKL